MSNLSWSSFVREFVDSKPFCFSFFLLVCFGLSCLFGLYTFYLSQGYSTLDFYVRITYCFIVHAHDICDIEYKWTGSESEWTYLLLDVSVCRGRFPVPDTSRVLVSVICHSVQRLRYELIARIGKFVAIYVMRIWVEYFPDVKIEKCIYVITKNASHLQVVSCLLFPKYDDQLVKVSVWSLRWKFDQLKFLNKSW